MAAKRPVPGEYCESVPHSWHEMPLFDAISIFALRYLVTTRCCKESAQGWERRRPACNAPKVRSIENTATRQA
jgi:hypothetical protein